MKNLRFESIRICSISEQKAIQVNFHPKRTLIRGANSTGKSAIVKSLFRSFDADPQGKLRNWDYDAIIATEFTLDGEPFTVLRQGELKALFSKNTLLEASSSRTIWAEVFAAAMEYRLPLLDQQDRFRVGSPETYFLPFYVNQDGSFGPRWETFKQLKQFKEAPKSVLEYFLGVYPAEFFDYQAKIFQVKRRIGESDADLVILDRTKKRLRTNVRVSPIKLSEQGFEQEVGELTKRSSELGAKQQTLRERLVGYQQLSKQLADQIRLANAALKQHEQDFKVVPEIIAEQQVFRCPTCHAEHDASFHTLLDLAEDARELYSLKSRLEVNLESTEVKVKSLRNEVAALHSEFTQINQLLGVRKGDLTFKDVVQSQGIDAAEEVLESECRGLREAVIRMNAELAMFEINKRKLLAEHDSKAPVDRFRDAFTASLNALNVSPYPNQSSWRLATRPEDSGSRGPRAVVAYYSGLWAAIAGNGGKSLPVPIVIDSPNQQAQDRKNLERLIVTVAEHTPQDAQVILCTEEDAASFRPNEVIVLDREGSLLREEEFDAVSSFVFPLVEKARMRLIQGQAAE